MLETIGQYDSEIFIALVAIAVVVVFVSMVRRGTRSTTMEGGLIEDRIKRAGDSVDEAKEKGEDVRR